MYKTRPPCFDEKSDTDCPKRYVGCKSWCEDWHKWIAIHEAEKAEIRRKKYEENEVKAFLDGQWLRAQKLPEDRFWKEKN